MALTMSKVDTSSTMAAFEPSQSNKTSARTRNGAVTKKSNMLYGSTEGKYFICLS